MTEIPPQINYRALIDGLGQGVLLFSADGTLVLDNLAARAILGQNLILIRAEGWEAMAILLDGPRENEESSDTLWEKAQGSPNPIRFHTYFSGAYTPCWMAAIYGANGTVFRMVVIEKPDWKALTELLATFRSEARMSLSATRGHAELVKQLLRKSSDIPEVQSITKRVLGFTDIIATHMLRLQNLMSLLHRLEVIRTGELPKLVREGRRKINLVDFLEDFLEEFADESQADPDMGGGDFRDRLIQTVPPYLQVYASPTYLTNALRDILKNAACYSPPDIPIELKAFEDRSNHFVQIDVVDLGYGIRAKEQDRVFKAFQRARQPQIIGVDGYGLSLYLTKAEIEAMGGRIWFESEEGIGSTFSLKLPKQPTGETLY